MKATSPKELQLFDRLVAALSGCPQCTWDEAEGGLVDHCNRCCRRVTAASWLFCVEATRIKPVLDAPAPAKRHRVHAQGTTR